METDTFFWQLLQKLPETLFALIGLSTAEAARYRFVSPEVKNKSFRLDGLFLPKNAFLPLYYVEFQFQRNSRFYVNLFGKVFTFLENNNPDQDWVAVAIFGDRSIEPRPQPSFQEMLRLHHVRRIYLDELSVSATATPGLQLLQLVTSPEPQMPRRVSELLNRARADADCERGRVIVELTEEVLMRRFTEMNREEVRRMFKLHDLRESRVWQEAFQEGEEEGIQKGIEKGIEKGRAEERLLMQRELLERCLAEGMPLKEIAKLLNLPLAKVRRMARR
jgi:predicted transposase/invertase (TIGR01784 family)